MKRASFYKRIIFSLIGLMLGALFITLCLHYYENFHAVISKKYYRSAELTGKEFTEKVNQYQLKSVINLRGENLPYHWYQDESVTLKQLNVPLYNVRLSSYILPSMSQLRSLVTTLESAPKPTLIHCASGADRSGLASAMVILLHNGTINEAKQQTSWYYGAIWPDSAGKLMLKQYISWLKQNHYQQSTAAEFKSWLGIGLDEHTRRT